MRTNPTELLIATSLLATVLLCRPAFSQPLSPGIVDPVTGIPAPQPGAHRASPGTIDPAVGLPVPQPGGLTRSSSSQSAGPETVNPATGLPISQPVERTPDAAVNAAFQTALQVQMLTFSQRYEEALQRCLAYYDQWKTSASLSTLLGDWVELGRRYPKAKTALLNIRDHDVREFSEGRGYLVLFQEVSIINQFLGQNESTYKLFKSFRDKDSGLAQQCYILAEGLCVGQGDYQWCYDHMGDPQTKFDSIHGFMKRLIEIQEHHETMVEATQKQTAAMRQQRGLTNMLALSSPNDSTMRRRSIVDYFVGQTRQLIEILVGTGHKAEAEKIRDRALTVLDDARLKSAVTDAISRTAVKS